MRKELEAAKAHIHSKYKVRVYAQAFVYQRRSKPKKIMANTQWGVQVPVDDWYDEFECPQLAVNYNGLYIKKDDLDKLLKELNEAVINSLADKGLIQ